MALNRTKARVMVVDTQREFESSEDTRRLARILRARFVKIAPQSVKSVAKTISKDERDAKVFALYEQVAGDRTAIDPHGSARLWPSVIRTEKTDLLKMIASFDRPEAGVRALPEAC